MQVYKAKSLLFLDIRFIPSCSVRTCHLNRGIESQVYSLRRGKLPLPLCLARIQENGR